MKRSPFQYAANGDRADAGFTLGYSAANSITQLDVAGHGYDELSFKFLAQVPAYAGQFTWSTSTGAGANLAS